MKLIVFSGLPGTGKSALAEALGRHLSIPVFTKDWLEATLVRSEMIPSNPDKPLGSAGYQLLTTLTERQLKLGQSAILDSVARPQPIREIWYRLAQEYGAKWRAIQCICSDESFHRTQLEKRERNIPGWYEVSWSDVEQLRRHYLPWEGERLSVDMMNPFEINLASVIKYCE